MRQLLLAISLILTASLSMAAETYTVYEASDLSGNEKLIVLSTTEAKNFQKEIEAERKVWEKAITAISQEWRTGDTKETFPRSAVKQRKLTAKGRPTSQEKAEADLQRREELAAKRAAKQPKRMEPKLNPKAQARANEAESRRQRALTDLTAKLSELTGHKIPSYEPDTK